MLYLHILLLFACPHDPILSCYLSFPLSTSDTYSSSPLSYSLSICYYIIIDIPILLAFIILYGLLVIYSILLSIWSSWYIVIYTSHYIILLRFIVSTYYIFHSFYTYHSAYTSFYVSSCHYITMDIHTSFIIIITDLTSIMVSQLSTLVIIYYYIWLLRMIIYCVLSCYVLYIVMLILCPHTISSLLLIYFYVYTYLSSHTFLTNTSDSNIQ